MLMSGKPTRIEIPEEHFLKIKDEAEKLYRNITPMLCPYLKKKVLFDAKGLDHIKFKSWNSARSRYDQYIRLKLFPYVSNVISKSHTLQGINEVKEWQRIKRKTGWEKIPTEVTYYEFVAVVGKSRIKVIVKQLIGGEPHFWSIIPFWRMNDITNKKKLFDGNPETD
jgi:hypothetical protein